MLFSDFEQTHGGMECTLDETIQDANRITDNPPLATAAKKYIKARKEIEALLTATGIDLID